MTPFQSSSIALMMQRSLNMVDPRLVDHGVRVAYILDAMLQAEGGYDEQTRQVLRIVALLHDIGAYRTDEIDCLVKFETETAWEHSIYGYLFLRELTPLGRWAEIVLYHHMCYSHFSHVRADKDIVHLSQLLYVADRVDVFLVSGHRDMELLSAHFEAECGYLFAPDAIDLFIETDRRCHLIEKLLDGVVLNEVMEPDSIPHYDADLYLKMLVHAIDFRSHHTVTHTINTMNISLQIAMRMQMDEDSMRDVYYGAMLHDLGKIGIPTDILEKPGKLTPEETAVMRTHVDLTEDIIKGCVSETVARIALRHHEKLNGSGYPRHLRAEELTLAERIVAIGDIVSALSGTRSYKQAFPKEKVFSILENMGVHGQLDADVIDVMIRNFDEIMEETSKISDPILDTYATIQHEYVALLKRFSTL